MKTIEETIVQNTWTGRELMFAKKDTFFSKYKIVNALFERERVYE